MANNATNSAVAALSSSRPSLCEQSELQCFAPVGDHAAPPRPYSLSANAGRATIASGPCDVRLWVVQRPPLGRATTEHRPAFAIKP